MITQSDVIKVGKLQKTHGIKGEIILAYDKPEYADIDADFYFIEIDGTFIPFMVEEVTFFTDDTARIKLKELENEAQAAVYSNHLVYVDRNLIFADTEEETDNWSFFEGFQVLDATSNETIGIIESVDDSTINVLFIINDGEKEILIPATEDFIVSIDTEIKTIVMNLPEGLLEE